MKKEKVKAEEEERKPTLTSFIKTYIRYSWESEYIGGVYPEHLIGWGGPWNYVWNFVFDFKIML
jgi:hypothetical protein